MRRVAQHVAALAQGVEDQRQVHLLEIAHAAMHELGAAAGGFFGEVGTLYKQRAVAASGGFHRCTQASGPPPPMTSTSHVCDAAPSWLRISCLAITPVTSFPNRRMTENSTVEGASRRKRNCVANRDAAFNQGEWLFFRPGSGLSVGAILGESGDPQGMPATIAAAGMPA